jgi:DNA topoisomerase IA
MDAWLEEMKTEIRVNNEKFEALQGTRLPDRYPQARTETMQEKTDANLKEIKSGQRHLEIEVKASKEETNEEMKMGQAEMIPKVSAIQRGWMPG